jgi:hypothetical protein
MACERLRCDSWKHDHRELEAHRLLSSRPPILLSIQPLLFFRAPRFQPAVAASAIRRSYHRDRQRLTDADTRGAGEARTISQTGFTRVWKEGRTGGRWFRWHVNHFDRWHVNHFDATPGNTTTESWRRTDSHPPVLPSSCPFNPCSSSSTSISTGRRSVRDPEVVPPGSSAAQDACQEERESEDDSQTGFTRVWTEGRTVHRRGLQEYGRRGGREDVGSDGM